jgi:hypothetical protein
MRLALVALAGCGRIAFDPGADPTLVLALGFETTGDVVVDSSIYGNDGTRTSTLGFAPGVHGSALAFDAAGDYVTIPDRESLDLSGTELTIAMWLVLAGNDLSDDVVVSKPWIDGTNIPVAYQVGLEFDDNMTETLVLFFTDAAETPHAHSSPANLPLTTPFHLAVTYDGALVRWYVDGALAAEEPEVAAIAPRTNPLRLGVDYALGQQFSGTLDDLRIYRRALLQDEIQGLLNTPVRRAL